jgi:ribosome-associated protein
MRDEPIHDEELPERPSKSARKREAQAAQDLGEALIDLNDAELEALNLPENLLDAIRLAKRITSRSGGARQRQYIGKLMREIDTAPIQAALAARREQAAREARRFKQVEAWRERLISEGERALDDLAALHPKLDRAEWARRIFDAQRERARTGATGAASRDLFRALRALFDQPAA